MISLIYHFLSLGWVKVIVFFILLLRYFLVCKSLPKSHFSSKFRLDYFFNVHGYRSGHMQAFTMYFSSFVSKRHDGHYRIQLMAKEGARTSTFHLSFKNQRPESFATRLPWWLIRVSQHLSRKGLYLVLV